MIDSHALVSMARALADDHGLHREDVPRIVDAMLDADEIERCDVTTVRAGLAAARRIAAE